MIPIETIQIDMVKVPIQELHFPNFRKGKTPIESIEEEDNTVVIKLQRNYSDLLAGALHEAVQKILEVDGVYIPETCSLHFIAQPGESLEVKFRCAPESCAIIVKNSVKPQISIL